jgi:hypothetical protein
MTTRLISLSDVLGELAGHAVRQSPYVVPDTLREALEKFNSQWIKRFPPEIPAFPCRGFTERELHETIQELVEANPFIVMWNERKNGNTSPLGFTSRYDRPEPDNDFIDLYALSRNVANCVWHRAADYEETDSSGDSDD